MSVSEVLLIAGLRPLISICIVCYILCSILSVCVGTGTNLNFGLSVGIIAAFSSSSVIFTFLHFLRLCDWLSVIFFGQMPEWFKCELWIQYLHFVNGTMKLLEWDARLFCFLFSVFPLYFRQECFVNVFLCHPGLSAHLRRFIFYICYFVLGAPWVVFTPVYCHHCPWG